MVIYLHFVANYKYDIAKWLIEQEGVEKVIIPYLPSLYDEKESETLPEGIVLYDLDKVLKDISGIVDADFEAYPPLDKDTMYKALEYESMFIHMCAHKYALPTGAYDEGKARFLQYIRYWKKTIEEYGIDTMYFEDVPHWEPIYVAYATAKILGGIKTTIFAPIGMRVPEIRGYVYVYGDSLETIGESVRKAYEESNLENGSVELEGIVKYYYEKSIKRNSEASISPKSRGGWVKYVRNAKYSIPNMKHPEIWVGYKNLVMLGGAIFKHHSMEKYTSRKYSREDIRDLKRYNMFHTYDAVLLKDYDKSAKDPDYNSKYILFPLQLWPEATTTPLGGQFAEQYTAIQLLAHVAKEYGIKVYVKEYYLQPYREKLFWDQLRNIENVVFIKSEYSSGELMKNALAVANVTGTCLMEAPFYGIPSLAFGKGYCFKGMPGLYEINDVDSCRNALDNITKGVKIDLEIIKKYYYCIQNNSIYYNRTPVGGIELGTEEYYKTVESLKAFLEKDISK